LWERLGKWWRRFGRLPFLLLDGWDVCGMFVISFKGFFEELVVDVDVDI
jgi:hypothetical protein